MKLHLDGQILASEASRLQIGAANCNQRGGGTKYRFATACDQLYPISVGTAGHVTGEEGHVTSLTSWRAACDMSARSFGLPTDYERPVIRPHLEYCVQLYRFS